MSIAKRIIIAAAATLVATPAEAANWKSWSGSKGPMYFQAGPTRTLQNCFGDCNASAATRRSTTSARVFTEQRVVYPSSYVMEWAGFGPAFPIVLPNGAVVSEF